MKQSRRIVALLLALIIVSALLPVSSFAAYKYQNLKFNQWYKLKDYDYDKYDTVYKIRVTADTAIIMNWKNQKDDDVYATIYSDKECDESVEDILDSNKSSGQNGVVLYPGTYYLRMHDDKETTQVKFIKKSVKSINKPNYCLQNAISLKAKKQVEFAQTQKQNYDRWYKIKLTKSQKITITTNKIPESYYIYDSNLNEIRCKGNSSNHTITTYGNQSKGTYYIVFYDNVSELYDNGHYHIFSWK